MYISRLEYITDLEKEANFTTTLKEIFNNLETYIDKNNSKDIVKSTSVILHGLIDYKIEKELDNFEPYILNAINLAGLLLNKSISAKRLKRNILNFKKQLLSLEDIMNYETAYKGDLVTLDACNPKYSKQTSDLITKELNGELLFIALCHGGAIPAIDVYQRLDRKDSILYLARFSKYKAGDKEPKLSESEEIFLQNASKNREIIIFDEDNYTNRTLSDATNFFRRLLNKYTFAYVNLDRYDEYAETQFTGE